MRSAVDDLRKCGHFSSSLTVVHTVRMKSVCSTTIGTSWVTTLLYCSSIDLLSRHAYSYVAITLAIELSFFKKNLHGGKVGCVGTTVPIGHKSGM
jgi:hypothetical protein